MCFRSTTQRDLQGAIRSAIQGAIQSAIQSAMQSTPQWRRVQGRAITTCPSRISTRRVPPRVVTSTVGASSR